MFLDDLHKLCVLKGNFRIPKEQDVQLPVPHSLMKLIYFAGLRQSGW
jgi:hypothetical protein